MSYGSAYNGTITATGTSHPDITSTVTQALKSIPGQWLDPEKGVVTTVTTDPKTGDVTIDIEDNDTTWYEWREHLETLRADLAAQGIACHGEVRRQGIDSYDPDYERAIITPERTTFQTAWPTFPNGDEW